MFARPEELNVLAGNGGRPFEELLYDLIVAEASRHGIPPSAVHWDHRTNIGDGGRDIIVDATHSDPPRFIPRLSSIWSAKSGRDGIQPSTLKKELNHPRHVEVRNHLLAGSPYVWCALWPMSEDERADLQAKIVEVAKELNFDPVLVEVRSLTTLCSTLNDNPGLIAKHLPNLARPFEGTLRLGEWEAQDSFGFTTPFVDFGGRMDVVSQIRSHLCARKGQNVLHLAGLSGIGKTRTVLEACRDQRELSGVLYIPQYANFRDLFLQHLTRNSHALALIVIDEVPLEDVRSLTSKVDQFSNRIRIVTIGPARRNERGRPSANILVLQEPQTRLGVLEVIRRVGSGISQPVLESIAHFSAHDLRLALMLLEATRQDGNFRDLPIEDGEDVWRRVTSLFTARLGDLEAFRTHYPYLTFAIDIGVEGELRREMEEVARQFAVPVQRLDEAIDFASSCGLGFRSTAFFESTPRALAGHLFRQRVWGSLRPRLATFVGGLPDRLLRRFIERCQECTGPERQDMEEALDSFFQQELGHPDVTQLLDRNRSRLFKTWAELDPVRGMDWLRQAINSASDTQLKAFSGNPDAIGGWGGRRQIVWLCESLASFGEYFWNCEEVLFRLAQIETEPSIGNNSSKIWMSMFHIIFAFTEISFQERSVLLLRRLQDSNEQTFGLVFSAVEEALVGGSVSRIIPPAIVGGRLVPEPWKPATRAELYQLQHDFGQRVLEVISQLPSSMQPLIGSALISNLGSFVRFHFIPELRSVLDTRIEDVRRAVHVEVRQIIEDCDESSPDPHVNKSLHELREWENALRPKDLAGQIRELTSLDYWDAMRRERRTSKEQGTSPYRRLAEQVEGTPDIFRQLEEWFTSPEAKSCFNFALALGEVDHTDLLAPIVGCWLEAGACRSVVSGYLRGLVIRRGAMPDDWASRLETLAVKHAEYAATVTADADFSARGFQRINRLVKSGSIPATFLKTFLYGPWEPFVGHSERLELLELLLSPLNQREDSMNVALNLLEWWTDFGTLPLQSELAKAAVQLLRKTLEVRCDAGSWSDLLKSVAATHPEDAAELILAALTSDGPRGTCLQHMIMPTLLLLASSHPRIVMEAIGRRILRPEYQPFFGLLRFEGLFDAIGLEELKSWLCGRQTEIAQLIARHLSSPSVQQDSPTIPPVTDWVLTTFGKDHCVMDEFLRGRHAFEIRSGHARDRRAELEQALEPFRNHEKPWVKKWAEFELRENDHDAKLDDYLDDRLERM
jgi:hypothetical protein